MPKLIGIAIAKKIMGKMEEQKSTFVSIENGIEEDARGRKKKRQVTILFEEDWKTACKELNTNLNWTTRRANLFVRGINGPQKENAIIKIGDVKLKIHSETDPCDVMEKQKRGLKKALTPEWRGGVCCSVLQGGKIEIGNEVYVK